jgi:hypothetical protein
VKTRRLILREADEPAQPGREDIVARLKKLIVSDEGDPRIRISYETLTPSDEEDEWPEEERGWEDEEGVSMIPDEWDREEGLGPVDLAFNFLKDNYATDFSSSSMDLGGWWSASGESDIRTGAVTTRFFHLTGFTEDELEQVYEKWRQWQRRGA